MQRLPWSPFKLRPAAAEGQQEEVAGLESAPKAGLQLGWGSRVPTVLRCCQSAEPSGHLAAAAA